MPHGHMESIGEVHSTYWSKTGTIWRSWGIKRRNLTFTVTNSQAFSEPAQLWPPHYHFLPVILYKPLQHIQQSCDQALSSLLAEIKSIAQQINYWVNNVNGFLTILTAWLLTVPYFMLFQSSSGNEAPTCLAAQFPYQKKKAQGLLISLWITLDFGLFSILYYLLCIGWTGTYWNGVPAF